MSRRNQARRRRAYGRRQHELGERRSDHTLRWTLEEWQSDAGPRLDRGDEGPTDERRRMAGA